MTDSKGSDTATVQADASASAKKQDTTTQSGTKKASSPNQRRPAATGRKNAAKQTDKDKKASGSTKTTDNVKKSSPAAGKSTPAKVTQTATDGAEKKAGPEAKAPGKTTSQSRTTGRKPAGKTRAAAATKKQADSIKKTPVAGTDSPQESFTSEVSLPTPPPESPISSTAPSLEAGSADQTESLPRSQAEPATAHPATQTGADRQKNALSESGSAKPGDRNKSALAAPEGGSVADAGTNGPRESDPAAAQDGKTGRGAGSDAGRKTRGRRGSGSTKSESRARAEKKAAAESSKIDLAMDSRSDASPTGAEAPSSIHTAAMRPEISVSSQQLEHIELSPALLIPALVDQPATVQPVMTPEKPETQAEKKRPELKTDQETPEAGPVQELSETEEHTVGHEEPEQEFSPPTGQEPEQADDFADFPASFNDLSPEDVFEDMDASEEGKDGDQSGKKRRSRGRRGRGRKKAAALAAGQANRQEGEVESEAEEDEAPEFETEPEAEEKIHEEDQEVEAKESAAEAKAARRKMFVSVLPEEQVEVAITEEGQVLEYYVEMLHQAKTKGNIYKGVIHNVDPNLQAAFVSYGAMKNGFLQIDEVHPEYYNVVHEAEKGRKYPPIQKVLKPGQEVLVQVVKEPAGTKGAFLTTYLSIPGRYLVLTPGREQIGVSRKVENEKERARLRELLEGLNPGQGLGVIVRTVSMGASKSNLQRDLQFLKRTWKEVRTRGTTDKAPCIVYQEQDLTARAIRDYLTENIGEVWVDDEKTAEEVSEIAVALFPRKQNLVRIHKEDSGTSLFERFNLQRQLDQIHSREVSLPSGGRLVIDPTEALTAIDINSGRSGGKNNFEDMAYRTNMEAAKMIPLQLRLRDIGGQVVADFIEMRDKSHWREVEKTLRNGMKVDRARYDVGKIGPFGLLEIVRQRLGSSAISVSTELCPCCNGSGIRRNMEWQSQRALRDILRALRVAQSQEQESVLYAADAELALHLLNHKRQRLLEMEKTYGITVTIEIKRG